MKCFLTLCLTLLTLALPAIVTAATEERTALVIGNGGYSTGSLKNPVNDADDMAVALKRLGFNVILKKNAAQQDMEDAIRAFGDRLKKGGVGLFFYAGHGVQISGKNFLLPIGVKIDRETDVKYRAVDADMVLDEMGNAGNPMNIVILDACRDNPFGKTFRTASRGLAIISSAPRGTLISYSTSPSSVAADGSGRNSPYTGSLMKHMMIPRLPIEEVFKNVRQDLVRETQGKQIPWELSSLEGRFYFNEQSGSGRDVAAEGKRLDDETTKITQERELLEKQKTLDVEKEKLESLKREQLKQAPPVVEKKEVAIVTPPTDTGPRETRRDGRFIAYDNGTILDTRTNLMWAAKDNGININWENAKSYCENYRGGGYSDWRMPTKNELARLYYEGKGYNIEDKGLFINTTSTVFLTELIHLSACCPWALEENTSESTIFDFTSGSIYMRTKFLSRLTRALPVRFGK
ncbi:MAG: caspase family protein [Syntrophales bacterium]